MAMENGPFVSDFPLKTSIYEDFPLSIAMFDETRGSHPCLPPATPRSGDLGARLGALSHLPEAQLGLCSLPLTVSLW